MSGAGSASAGAGSRSMSSGNGPPSAGAAPQQTSPSTTSAGSASSPSQQNLNQIVLEYLSKKGYNRTEAMLRRESAQQGSDGRPIIKRAEDRGGRKYDRAFELLRDWIESSLDLYKAELDRLLWPVFVYSFLNLAAEFFPRDCGDFFNKHKDIFMPEHQEDLRVSDGD